MGIPCLRLNGGPEFPHTDAFSFQVLNDHQAEANGLWDAVIHNGGKASACGWCEDRWGLSWQITPRTPTASMSDHDPPAAQCVLQAMMEKTKIDIAAVEAARRG